MPPARGPTALLPAPVARTLGFALLATLGAAEWARMVEGGGLGLGLPWVLTAVLAGEAVRAAATLPPRARAPAAALVAALGFVLAALVSGLEPRQLAPAHWSELGAGVSRGLEALSGVTLPYGGVDPWPDITLRLGGALLVTLAAVLASWPREQGTGFPFFALAALLVLVATPVTAIGTPRSLLLGAALAALTVCFLWLERLPLRPGLGVAALGGLALAGALPLSAAADRDTPWFDYRTWAEGLGTPASVRFDWEHSYGPLGWRRDGREMLRIRSPRPQYWKLENLEDFDGQRWLIRRVPPSDGLGPDADLDREGGSKEQWRGNARVTVRGLRGINLAGAGTTLSIDAGSQGAQPAFSPGTWQSDRELGPGDSYGVRFHAPRPNSVELSAASSGAQGDQGDALQLVLPLLRPQLPEPGDFGGRPATAVRLEVRPYAASMPPLAHNERRDTTVPGIAALRNSPYWRTWQLAQRLKRGARTPYEFARRVDLFLDQGFRYDERPTPVPAGEPPLAHFLFTTKAGYCQHFSGAMALLLRLGGVPARIATGFSPGGFRRRQGEWVVRDRDAHSWVEAWFDGIGWVTMDPTPAATPARSLIAAINAPGASETGDGGSDGLGLGPRSDRNPAGGRGPVGSVPSGPGAGDGDGGAGVSGLALAAALVTLGLALVLIVLWLRPRGRPRPGLAPADRAVAELLVVLRRAGRPVAPGTTLSELERRLCGSPDGAAYFASLRELRFGTAADGPSARERRALRRELSAGGGWRGRLRAWWALPPQRG